MRSIFIQHLNNQSTLELPLTHSTFQKTNKIYMQNKLKISAKIACFAICLFSMYGLAFFAGYTSHSLITSSKNKTSMSLGVATGLFSLTLNCFLIALPYYMEKNNIHLFQDTKQIVIDCLKISKVSLGILGTSAASSLVWTTLSLALGYVLLPLLPDN